MSYYFLLVQLMFGNLHQVYLHYFIVTGLKKFFGDCKKIFCIDRISQNYFEKVVEGKHAVPLDIVEDK